MDPLINDDPSETEPEPTIPSGLAARLMRLFSLRQLDLLAEHTEEVACPGRHGEVVITWREGRIVTIGHQASDRA